MSCPLCDSRKAKRACPALGHAICPVCCGTKRLTEIACPPDCPYLASARLHPPAMVTRQRERDLRFTQTVFHDLAEEVSELLLFFQAVLIRYRKTALLPVTDLEVAAAAGAMAATLETAGRGIIYEHQATLPAAQRLVNELRAALGEVAGEQQPRRERHAAVALRRLEQSAKGAASWFGGSDSAFLDFLDRLPEGLHAAALEAEAGGSLGPAAETPDRSAPRIILP